MRRAGVRIRRARLADAREIAAVMSASIRTLARGSTTPRRIALWSSLPPLYHAWAMSVGGERYVVAGRRGRIDGYAALRGSELTALFVRPGAARGGIGAALLARVEREARRGGATRLRVAAAPSALAFYAAMGFRRGRPVSVPLPGGAALPARLLSKRIGGRAPPR